MPEPAHADYSGIQPQAIQWRVYAKVALPLAALTGFVAAMFVPAVLVAFPLSFRRTLSQYRRFHPGPLPSRQGGRLGAFMALLSFVAFLAFFLPITVLAHDSLVDRFRAMAAQSADPMAQQAMLWATTPSGFVVVSVFAVVFVLVVLLLLGLLCGALMTGRSENRS